MRFRNPGDNNFWRQDLTNNSLGGYFAPSQAARLLPPAGSTNGASLGCVVVHQIDLSAFGQWGFSATLLRDTINQRYVLAIRGTEPSGVFQDIVVADLFGIFADGIAGQQFADLLVYVKQLSTAGGELVVFSDDEIRHLARLTRTDIYWDASARANRARPFDELRAQFAGIVGIGEPGQAALLGDAPFAVVGHSLGGHLASLAGAYLGSRVTEVVTFNAPGFSAGRLAEVLGVPLGNTPPTTNVEAFAGIEVTAGFRGHTGMPVEVFTENQGAVPNPAANHSIYFLSNSIAVAELLSRIDPNLEVSTFNRLMAESSVQENRSEEAVVELVLRLLGSESIIPTDIRSSLMDRIGDAHARIDAAAGGLGVVTIRALSELTSTELELLFQTDEGVRYAVLNGNTMAFSGLAYAGALAVPAPEDFTLEFVRDRCRFMRALASSNSMNLGEVQGGGEGSQAYIGMVTYEWRSGPDLRALRVLGYEQLEESEVQLNLPTVVFGSDAADIVVASDDAPSGGHNRLYGLDGDDTLYGGVGDDLLDGGDGLDAYRIVAGEGRDTVLDADGRGVLWVQIEGTWHQLTGAGERIDAATWVDEALGVSYFFDGSSLLVEVGGSTITIRGWQPGGNGPTVQAHRESDDGRVGMQAVASGSMLGISRPDYAVDQLPQAPAYTRNVSVGSGYGASGGQATTGADTLYGDGANDSFRLGAGNDFAATLDGSDRVDGEDGDDTLRGDGGDDVVIGGAGLDVLLGGTGNDRLYATAETTRSDATAVANQPAATGARGEYLDGDLGNDTLVGAGGNDLLLGGEGEDWVFGSSGNDTVYGDRSTYANRVNMDTGGGTAPWSLSRSLVNGSNGSVSYSVTIQNAQLAPYSAAGAGNDRIDGGAGDDWLFGEGGDDLLMGGADHDLLIGGLGRDTLLGGSGNDNLHGDEIGANAPTEAHGSDLLDGGDGDDILVGNGAADTLLGGEGADQLIGDDTTTPVQYHGNDVLDGGTGNDVLIGLGANDSLDGGDGDDNLQGDYTGLAQASHGSDRLNGGTGADQLFGQGGNDVLSGGDGNDILIGDGNTSSPIAAQYSGSDVLDGGDGDDSLIGGDGDDVLSGGSGDDQLIGDLVNENGAGDDVMDGGVGDDYLSGGVGDDVLTGGAGSDTLQGGAGDDDYHTGDGVDTIVDGRGANVLDLGSGATISQLRVEALYGGNSSYSISWGGSDAVLLSTSEGSGFTPLSFAELENLYSIRVGASGQTVNFRHLLGRYQEVAVVRDAHTDTGTYGVIAFGSAVDDSIAFAGGQGQMYGGHGDDEFVAVANILGMRGGNSYLYEIGDGADTITDSGAMGAQTAENVVRFGAGIVATDLRVTFIAGDNETVVVQIGDDPTQRLQLRHSAGGFRRSMGEQSVIDRFEFADGTSVTWAQLVAAGFDFTGTGDADVIVGSGAVDRMVGFEGNDTLNGLRGADVLDGGAGDDLYIINNGASLITEGVGGGIDTVRFVGSATSLSYALAANVENLELSWELDSAGSLALDGTGNALDNLITGNVANNTIDGGAGNDHLEGELGDDVIIGGSGDDVIDGGAGLDTYRFGANHGSDVIESQAGVYARQRQDVVVFEAHASTDVRTVRNGNDLVIEPVAGGTPLLVLRDFFTIDSEVAELRFNNAVTLTWQQILAAHAPVFTNGADTAVGSDLPDTFRLLDGNDTAAGSFGDDSLYGDGGNDSVAGEDGNDLLDGGAGNDALDGGLGNDTLVGGTGSDSLTGGFGQDIYLFDRGFGTDSIQGVQHWEGTQPMGDTVRFGAGIVLADLIPVLGPNGLRLHVLRAGGIIGDSIDLIEHWNMAGSADFDGVVRFEFADGSSATLDQVLATTIRVTQGADAYRPSLTGGTVSLLGGADVFSGQDGADIVDGGDGDDALDGTGGDDRLSGGQGFDTLNGGDGVDELDGGRGLDFLNGGLGADRYLVSRNSGRDLVTDDGGANELVMASGIVRADLTFIRQPSSYGADGVAVIIGGGQAQVFLGQFFAAGSPSTFSVRFADGSTMSHAEIVAATTTPAGTPNAMTGTSGNDTFVVDHVGDTVTGAGAGTDLVRSGVSYSLGTDIEQLELTGTLALDGTGNSLNNTLRGNAGANVLDGGTGTDTLIGGNGDDIYYIGNYVQANTDVITELSNGGYDTAVVQSWNLASIGDHVEEIRVEDMSRQSGWSSQRTIKGNAQANIIDGSAATTALILDGGAGADTFYGGTKDDTFVVDNAGDIVRWGGSGTDTVKSSVSYVLGSWFDTQVENITLTGTGATSATGNQAANVLDGSQASGANILTGLGGNDNYVLGAGDTVVESSDGGTDTVTLAAGAVTTYELSTWANVENLVLGSALGNSNANGTSVANRLEGNSGNNRLDGKAGDDTLIGANGNDTLIAGAGNDSLQGGAGTDRLTAGTGIDVLDGGTGVDTLEDIDQAAFGNTTYVFARGYGKDTVTERGGTDTIQLASGIATADVTLTRSGNNLVLSIAGTTDTLTVVGFYATGTSYDARVESVRFNDGTTWDLATMAGGLSSSIALASESSLVAPAESPVDASGQDSPDAGIDPWLVASDGSDTPSVSDLDLALVPEGGPLTLLVGGLPGHASPWLEVDEWTDADAASFAFDQSGWRTEAWGGMQGPSHGLDPQTCCELPSIWPGLSRNRRPDWEPLGERRLLRER